MWVSAVILKKIWKSKLLQKLNNTFFMPWAFSNITLNFLSYLIFYFCIFDYPFLLSCSMYDCLVASSNSVSDLVNAHLTWLGCWLGRANLQMSFRLSLPDFISCCSRSQNSFCKGARQIMTVCHFHRAEWKSGIMLLRIFQCLNILHSCPKLHVGFRDKWS